VGARAVGSGSTVVAKGAVTIDEDAVKRDARLDGKFL